LTIAIIAITGVVLVATLVAQETSRNVPVRGTATIRGRVLHLDSGAPLRGAFVQLDQGGDPARAGAITDDSGQYVIEGVTSGRRLVHASKVGYVTSSFSRRSPKRVSREVEVSDGQTVSGIDFALATGSVIVARLTDEFGEPAPGVTVDALSVGPAGLAAGSSGATNDLGVVRLYGLMPGAYLVRTGGLNTSATTQRSQFLPTYYPGTPYLSQAQRVAVGAAQEASVSFSRAKGVQAVIRGVVRGVDGVVPPFQLPLVLAQAGSSSQRQVNVTPGALFEASNIWPGEYVLEVRQGVELARGEKRFIRMPLTVTGEDLLDLVVLATPGGTLRGRIESDTGFPLTGVTPDALARQLSLLMWRPAFAGPSGVSSPASAVAGELSLNADLTFEARGIMEPRVIRLREPVGGWSLKVVMLDDRDVTDLPIDLSDGRTVSDLRVVLTRSYSRISGSIAGHQPGAVAVIFPEDPRQWTPFTRAIAAAPAARDGSFVATGLPAGRYLAAAVSGLGPGEEHDPSVLEAIRPFATPLSLAEAESLQMALRFLR
jgi:hypothetical protein